MTNYPLTTRATAPVKYCKNTKKRGFLLFSVFLFPIVLTSIIFLPVLMMSDIDFKTVGSKTQFAEIISPKNQSIVAKKFTITGTLNTPLDNHRFYLLEYREKKYWPKYSLGSKMSRWSRQLSHRAKKNHYATFQVIMADETLQDIIEKWFKTARKTKQYPGITDLNIEHVVASIRVKKQ